MKSIKNIYIFLTLTAALGACAPDQRNDLPQTATIPPDHFASNNIIGGSIVGATDEISRSTVALIILDASNPRGVQRGGCTGTILEKNIVITAAHCIPQRGAIIVAFATHSNEVTSFEHPKARVVQAVEVHPQAFANATTGDMKNFADLALLKFEGDLPPGYRPVQLLQQNRPLRTGMSAVLAGYGLTNAIKHTSDNMLRKTTVTIADAKFSASETLMDETKGRASCNGDSGGPAFVILSGKVLQFGVLSRGHNDPTGTCRGNSIYTNINAHLDWIKSAQQKLVSAIAVAAQ